MSTEAVWVALVASLMMGLAGACLFVFAVKKGYFRDLEDTKYQVFWSDVEEIVDSSLAEESH
ncbi:MAG: cbb3-type cytochrome oxidase assembly protein CcoS, partial [Bryobacteraceae bacterium]